jgi:hypothetical protein
MLTTVVTMLPARTLLVASPVTVTRDTPAQEMVSLVQVSYSPHSMHFYVIVLQILMSVLLMLTTVVTMLPARTLLVASPVTVTRDTPAQEMVSLVQVSLFPVP